MANGKRVSVATRRQHLFESLTQSLKNLKIRSKAASWLLTREAPDSLGMSGQVNKL